MLSKRYLFPLGAYGLILASYSVFSYALTAPNLVLTSWPPYWNFQQYMWDTFFNNRALLAQTYLALIVALFISYGYLLYVLLRSKNWAPKKWYFLLLPVVGLSLPLLLSNNALSYDVFNYIFNAKMVVVFNANPHVQTATDFLNDDWTRFMHNVHTPAPYGYGWTALSLIPYLLGGGKFLLTWLAFRLFSFVSVALLALTYGYAVIRKKADVRVALAVLCNPLLLIEIISTSHNDVWMMVPAVWSLLLLSGQALPTDRQGREEKRGRMILLSGLLLVTSISLKLGTLMLAPLWLGLVLLPLLTRPLPGLTQLIGRFWPLAASALMFLPLLTLRSQQFHPWYLTWVLVWLPFIGNSLLSRVGRSSWVWLLELGEKIWIPSIVVLSMSSMLRYLPYLATGTYGGGVLWQQKVITWVPFVGSLVLYGLYQLTRKPTTS